MKRLFFSLVVVALATPLSANLIQPISASGQILIPAAGSVEGANGTFFRSEVVVVNFAQRTQQISMRWIPHVDSDVESQVTVTTLGPNAGFRYDDFVRQVLGQRGLGSVIITAVTNGQADPNGLLYATSRIYTISPAAAGQASQSFDTIPTSTINTPQTVAIFGLRRSSLFRVNVGIVNLDPVNAQTFLITDPTPLVDPPITYTLTIPPMRMRQINLPGDAEVPQINVQNITANATRTTQWIAYGSSVDNVTGDSWSEIAITGQ